MYVSGRWHTKGHQVVYTSEDPSTALLETLVHLEIDTEDQPENFQVLKIQSSSPVEIERFDSASLGEGWETDPVATRAAGDEWLRSTRTALLQVPSILVPERFNFLINPLHPQAGELRIVTRYTHSFDHRLLR